MPAPPAATTASLSPPSTRLPNFDRLARAYRWIELLTFGPALHRCRVRLLPALSGRHALVLGDGDGRALHDLLRLHPALTATAVDLSPAMLATLRHRCAPFAHRLTPVAGDALAVVSALPATASFDLVTTHFFLDCFSQPALETLVATVTQHTTPIAEWLLSDFRIPSGWRALPALLLVRLLYLACRLLTSLRVHQLPDHARALTLSGWTLYRRDRSLGGLLTAELWHRTPPREQAPSSTPLPH